MHEKWGGSPKLTWMDIMRKIVKKIGENLWWFGMLGKQGSIKPIQNRTRLDGYGYDHKNQ